MSRKFMAFLLGAFVIAGGVFFWTLYGGLQGTPLGGAPSAGSPGTAAAKPAAPPPPSVAYEVRTSTKGNSFVIDWCNLPENTVALDILRKLKKGVSPWELWKQIEISSGSPACSSATFALGRETFAIYTFNIEAVGNITGPSGDITGQTIVWTSGPATAETAASNTPPLTLNPSTNNYGAVPSSTNIAQSQTSSIAANSSSTASTTVASTTSPIGNAATSTSSTAPLGTPYYNPEIKLQGYNTGPSGSFWVEYVNGRIEIGWQNLPASTDKVSIQRSQNSAGPWVTVISQSNIDPIGPSTIQIVDDTLNQTSYYNLEAMSASGAVIAFYGPVALPPL